MYLVTGGAGFIGSNVVAALQERGREPREIVVSDRLGDGGKWQNLAKREILDLVDPDDLPAFLQDNRFDVDAVIHLGAVSDTTETNVDLLMRTNFKLSLELWHWCTRHQVRFLYASSAATYGDGAEGFDDDGSPEVLARLRPLNPYAWSKHLFDRRVARMVAAGAMQPPQWVGLKFFNVYGPNEYHKGSQQSLVPQIYRQAKRGAPARLFKSHDPRYADGGQVRDFVWVGDCVAMVMWLLDNAGVSGLFNCGSGTERSFRDLAAAVFGALGREPEIEYVDTPATIRDRYQYFTRAAMGRLHRAGYEAPFTSLEDGIQVYVTQFLEGVDPYR